MIRIKPHIILAHDLLGGNKKGIDGKGYPLPSRLFSSPPRMSWARMRFGWIRIMAYLLSSIL